MKVEKIVSKWAGLRCYSVDKNPVYGKDSAYDDSFVWVAGLAGQGVQSCPGYSQLIADLTIDKPISNELIDLGFDYNDVSPNRESLNREEKESAKTL